MPPPRTVRRTLAPMIADGPAEGRSRSSTTRHGSWPRRTSTTLPLAVREARLQERARLPFDPSHPGVATVPAFADLVGRFLDELFELQPDLATAVGDHRFDDRWPDTSDAGRLARIAFADRWTATFRVAGRRRSHRRASASTETSSWASWPPSASRGGAARGDLGPTGVGLPDGDGPAATARRASFAPSHVRLASVAGRLEGIPRIIEDARAVLGSGPRPVSRLHAEVASRRIAGIAGLARDAVAAAEAAAPTDPDVAALLPRLRAAADRAAVVLAAIGAHLATEVAPTRHGRRRTRPRPVRREAAPHPAGPGRSRRRRSSPAPRPSTRPSAPRWSASPARSGRGGGPGSPCPTTRARWSAARSTRSRPTTRRPTDLVAFCREELGRIEAFCREHGVIGLVEEPLRDRLDAGVPARVRRRHAGLARAARRRPEVVLLDHAAPRGVDRRRGRVVPARDERAPAAAADDPRGGARPLPADGLREPGQLPRAPRLPVRAVRGGLGGLRHPGDARPRLRRRRPRTVARPLEVLPARRGQRDPRRPHPHHGHDRRGGALR